MKKLIIGALACSLLPFVSMSQDSKKEKIEKEELIEKRERPEKKERPERKETQEIIIRQDGDKEIKLKVEIDGEKITVNGKPLSEFKDENVTINKRKMMITDGDHTMSFSFPGENDWGKFGETFGENFGRQFRLDEDSKSAFLGVTTETEGNGVKVVEVVKGSAAEKAGLKKDDIITKVGDEKISSPESLSDVIGLKKPKDEVSIAYTRAGKSATAKATLGQRKQPRAYTFSSPRADVRSFSLPRLAPNMEGLMDDEDAPHLFGPDGSGYNLYPRPKKMGLKIQDTEEGNGVKVINVEDSSAAATSGIKKDDIITEIDGKKVENTDDAREQLAPDADKKLYKIKVNRGGSEMNFEVKIPRKLKTANL